jgi:hypothetical protein
MRPAKNNARIPDVIRNVVVGRLAPEMDRVAAGEQVDRALAGIAVLQLPGQLSVHIGRDAGLCAGRCAPGRCRKPGTPRHRPSLW